MKVVLTIVLLIVSTLAFTQVDTINYRPNNVIKNETTVNTTKTKDGKIVKSIQESNTIDDCNPCWLKYYDQDGNLLQEGLSYSDCALGKRTEYYKSGEIKVLRFFMTNNTNDWINFPCSVETGTWTYYKEDGSVEKTETYIVGKQIK